MGRMYDDIRLRAALLGATLSADKEHFMTEETTEVEYTPNKLTGFTVIKGRKHLTHKQRKQKNNH